MKTNTEKPYAQDLYFEFPFKACEFRNSTKENLREIVNFTKKQAYAVTHSGEKIRIDFLDKDKNKYTVFINLGEYLAWNGKTFFVWTPGAPYKGPNE